MITKQNMESLLDSLGFIQNDKVYTKTIGDITIGVDCAKQEIISTQSKSQSTTKPPQTFLTQKISSSLNVCIGYCKRVISQNT